jgi:hypothetical protein
MTYISGNTGAYQSGTFNKGTIALNLNPSSLASGNNWYNGVDVTATQYLIYSDTYSTGIATQANSKPTAWTTPDLSDTSLLNLINTLPDRIGLTPFTSLPLALQWLNATNEYFLIKTNFENIVTSGLVLNLDAGWYNSYSGTTTWFDRSGSGNNGTLVNSPTFNGSSQGAIVFDGTDDYVDCGNLSTLNNLTVQMFVNVTSNTGNYRAFAAAKGGSQDYDSGFNIDMMLGSSTSFSNCNIEGGFLRIPGGTNFMQSSVPFGTWCNICFTVSPTYIQFYLNGVPQYGTARLNNASSTIGMNSLSIGRRPIVDSAVNSFINAKISNAQIYNRALSPQEVLQNYNAQKSRFGIYDIVQSGLTINYDASNYLSYPRSGTTWFNMTSNPANGSLINGPTFNTGTTPSIQFDGTNDGLRADYNLSQFNTITINFLANAAYNNESMIWSLGPNGPDWYIKADTMGYNSYNGDTYGLSTTQINQLGLRNNWHMLTMTYTQNGAIANNKVYVDGIQQTIAQQQATTSPKTFSNTGINFLGAFNNDGYNINANVGHISVYNRELSSQEIVQNFESLRRQYPITGYTTSGLVLNLDAGNYASYPTTGTKCVDTSGNFNNGTLTNGPTWSSTSGGTFTFDGADDQINCGDVDVLGGATGATWEAWFKVNTINNSSYWKSIMTTWNDGDTGPGHTWIFDTHYASWSFWVRFVGDTDSYPSTNFEGGSSRNDFVANTWYHMVGVFDSSQPNADKMKIYINGSYVSSYNTGNYTTIAYKTANERLKIGVDRDVAAPFDGNIAITRLYRNKPLSASEVLQNYNALKGRFGL